MRQKCIVGNWKMNKTASVATTFVGDLVANHNGLTKAQVFLAPPFTALHAVRQVLGDNSPFQLAGQNLHWEDHGAFTGEVSAPMLVDVGCTAVILGHSERRHVFGEKDLIVNKKVHAALRHQLTPILCVGETLTEREQGHTNHIVTNQLLTGLEGLPTDTIERVIIAYEPVWAIGTGKAATAVQAIEVHQELRQTVARTWGDGVADRMKILYGGSVTPQNVKEFLSAEQIDGALVGGACLNPDTFTTIINFAYTLGE